MIAPNIFSKFEYKSNILFITTRNWNLWGKHNIMTDNLNLELSTIDVFSPEINLPLYRHIDDIIKRIKFIINKYNFKKIIFCGLCKDTHLQSLIVRDLYNDSLNDISFHIIGIPLMMNLNNTERCKVLCRRIDNKLNDKNMMKRFKEWNIINILKDIQTVRLYNIVANNNAKDIDITNYNIKEDTNEPLVNLKTYNIQIPSKSVRYNLHDFYARSLKHNLNQNVIQPRLKYLITKIINDNI